MLHLEAAWPSKENILIAETILAEPGPQPGFEVWEAKYVFRGIEFCFYHMFKTNLYEHKKIRGSTKKIWGNCLRMAHRVCGPGQNRRQKVWGPSCLCRGARHSENLFLIHNMNSICRLCKLIINIFPQIPIVGSQFPTKFFERA